eukprot:Sspe_Gene.19::Locus_4_Transcript_28_28_Confidence_0.132_Length_2082::g.19::m.19
MKDLDEDMEVTAFLQNKIFAEAYALAIDSAEPREAAGDQSDEEDELTGTDSPEGTGEALTAEALKQHEGMVGAGPPEGVIQRLYQRHKGRSSSDGSASDGEPEVQPDEENIPWNIDTVRAVMMGAEGRDRMQQVVLDCITDIASLDAENPSKALTVVQRVLPTFRTAQHDRFRIFGQLVAGKMRQFTIALGYCLGDFLVAQRGLQRLLWDDRYHTNHFWNVLNFMCQLNSREDYRGLAAMAIKKPSLQETFEYCAIIGGVIATRHGSVKQALGALLQAHSLQKDDPLMCLQIALQYQKLATSRYNPNHHWTLLHALSFLDMYATRRLEQNRGSCEVAMEVEFNRGRFYHQSGMAELAFKHYRKTLDIYDKCTEDGTPLDPTRR